MNRWAARLVTEGSPPDLVSGWRVMRAFIEKQLGISPSANFINVGRGRRSKFREYDRPLTLDEIEEEIVLDDDCAFVVSVGDLHEKAIARLAGSCQVESGDSIFTLSLWSDRRADWTPLVSMANAVLDLIYGYPYLPFYAGWQSETNIGRYEQCYGPADSRPKVMSGFPPIERLVIDTSLNPGREFSDNGEFKGVAAEMWFAPRFWERRELSPADVLLAVPGATAEEIHGLTRICSQEREFDRPDGEQGEIQKALWKVIFNREVRW
ncbi:hypothetical protein [Luteolibacter sp. Populi]|uniref:hypothetical protein n=1 Tax=Luteolibacter sp. Populi TaxID=3230487 RepID=UPI00346514AC